MTITEKPKTRSAEIRASLDYPVIDCDAHLREFIPLLEEYIEKVSDKSYAQRHVSHVYAGLPRPKTMPLEERQQWQAMQGAFWGTTMDDLDDYVTQIVPNRLFERLEDFGTDFAIVYPSHGLSLNTIEDDDLRRAVIRGLNQMNSELYNREFGYRIHVPAILPMHTPEEAIAELDYIVNVQGFKAVAIPPGITRPIPGLEEKYPGISTHAPDGLWVDRFGIDSQYDYDPVWEKFIELRVAVTCHGALMPSFPKLSRSISNYTFNHVRNQPSMQEQLCKAFYMGGVSRRFPQLNFAFMEGGVAYACNLLSDVVGHWEKRNRQALEHVNPANLDRQTAYEMMVKSGGNKYDQGSAEATFQAVFSVCGDVPAELDDFAAMKIEKKEDFKTLFSNFYFGCEADDRMTAHAFNTKTNRFGMKLKPILSSDIGHFDVVDMEKVLEEAYENVEYDVVSPEDFRAQVAENPVLLHGGMNPDFFKGTAVEGWATEVLTKSASR